MSVFAKSNRRVSARDQIDIKAVKDGILSLSHNRCRAVLQVASVNFELKSSDEQDAIIDTYESFLNSIGCPLQILIRIREIDMDKYLGELDERLAGETEAVYLSQLENYNQFIRSLITTNKILTRHFYIVVPFDAAGKADFESIKEQMAIRVDIVIKGLARLGMHARSLSSLETLDLFYSFYNPGQAKRQPLTRQALELLHNSLVETEAL